MVFKITLQLVINRGRRLKFDWVKTRGFHKVADEVPATSLVQIRKVFRLKNVPIQEGHACIAINCPICKPKKPSEFNVFVNKATGKLLFQFIILNSTNNEIVTKKIYQKNFA